MFGWEGYTSLTLGESYFSDFFMFCQSQKPWAYSHTVEAVAYLSQAFQRTAKRIKAQESVVHFLTLIILIRCFKNVCKNEWNSKIKPMCIYSNFSSVSDFVSYVASHWIIFMQI